MGDCSTATSLNDNLLNVCRVGTFMLGLEHVGFYCMEAEFWRTVGVKSFRVKKHEINPTSPLAANQVRRRCRLCSYAVYNVCS